MISLRAHRRDIAAGAQAMAPWLAGIVPFGPVIGISAAPIVVVAAALIINIRLILERHGYDC